MQEAAVETGNEMRTVGPAAAPIDEPSQRFKSFAREAFVTSQAAADEHNGTLARLIAGGVPRNTASRMLELMDRHGYSPDSAYGRAMAEAASAIPGVEHIALPMPPDPFRGLVDTVEEEGFNVLAPLAEPPRPVQTVLVGELLAPAAPTRADKVAAVYGLTRNPGEDDDGLNTRVRRYCAGAPGIVTPERIAAVRAIPHDYVPRPELPAPPKRRTGPIIDVEAPPVTKAEFREQYTSKPARRCSGAEHDFAPSTMVCARCGWSARELARESPGAEMLFEAIRDVERPEPGQHIIEPASDPAPADLRRVN
jgi:hypothetical protein